MATPKTTETPNSVPAFINSWVADEKKQADAFKLVEIFRSQTGFEPKMWGPSIIGFGSYHYKYASGHEGDAPLVGFSPRKDAISLYVIAGFERRDTLLAKLGKHKAAKACVYVKKLADIDEAVLRELIDESVKYTQGLYPAG